MLYLFGPVSAFQPNRKIIAVKVCRISGGVFTAVPESYYVDDDGNVKQFDDFEELRSQMLSSYKGIKSVTWFKLFFSQRLFFSHKALPFIICTLFS